MIEFPFYLETSCRFEIYLGTAYSFEMTIVAARDSKDVLGRMDDLTLGYFDPFTLGEIADETR